MASGTRRNGNQNVIVFSMDVRETVSGFLLAQDVQVLEPEGTAVSTSLSVSCTYVRPRFRVPARARCTGPGTRKNGNRYVFVLCTYPKPRFRVPARARCTIFATK